MSQYISQYTSISQYISVYLCIPQCVSVYLYVCSDVQLWMMRGQIEEQQGNTTAAREFYSKAVSSCDHEVTQKAPRICPPLCLVFTLMKGHSVVVDCYMYVD